MGTVIEIEAVGPATLADHPEIKTKKPSKGDGRFVISLVFALSAAARQAIRQKDDVRRREGSRQAFIALSTPVCVRFAGSGAPSPVHDGINFADGIDSPGGVAAPPDGGASVQVRS